MAIIKINKNQINYSFFSNLYSIYNKRFWRKNNIQTAQFYRYDERNIHMKTRFKYDTTGNWYKGNLHLHTTDSDGFLSDEDVIKRYAEEGYDFISITDHWKVYQQNGCRSNSPLLVLEGIELDGCDEKGANLHVLAIGVSNGLSTQKNFNAALRAASEHLDGLKGT